MQTKIDPYKGTHLFLITLLIFTIPHLTAANTGIYWLAATDQTDGSYSTPDDLATPFMATIETLQTFYQHNETTQPSITDALAFINTTPFPSTEILFQTFIIQALAGQTTETLHNQLITRIGEGLGDLKNYDSTVIDTAWTLEALSMTETPNEILTPAIQYLFLQQHQNGGWADNDNDTSVYLTAIVMHAIWQYRHQFPNLDIVLALNKAQDYLLAQQENDSLWGETFNSALALISIDGTPTTQTDAQGYYYIDNLTSGEHHIHVELQGYDSIAGTITTPTGTTVTFSPQLYLTGTTPPTEDNASVTGLIIDKATKLPLSGVTVTNGTETTMTDDTGQFHLTNLAAGETTLQWSLAGYFDKTSTVTLSPFTQLP